MTEDHDQTKTAPGTTDLQVTITLDPHVKAYVDRAVEDGDFESVSAAFNEAMLERMRRRTRVRSW
ncbi:hypothetical protein ACIBIZ_05965 [Nonomuraea spiralis]|uniref:Uncharacterized protein n=1 Tax=Nonomuraea spiralis TaxID=46182 RepID=A0ABV5I7X0_9ACTN|nr:MULTISPECIES: hypothetical protein [Nonomuraea]RSM95599.1 hypothetical protein DMB42_49535 [Nonomuraea sp. WAC 01424]GGS73426.1 hypothetical protein GCM10010176_015290 [Nonomuraea spiralis]